VGGERVAIAAGFHTEVAFDLTIGNSLWYVAKVPPFMRECAKRGTPGVMVQPSQDAGHGGSSLWRN